MICELLDLPPAERIREQIGRNGIRKLLPFYVTNEKPRRRRNGALRVRETGRQAKQITVPQPSVETSLPTEVIGGVWTRNINW